MCDKVIIVAAVLLFAWLHYGKKEGIQNYDQIRDDTKWTLYNTQMFSDVQPKMRYLSVPN